MTTKPPSPYDPKVRAARLGLFGVLAHWSEVAQEPWIERILQYEEAERQRRSLERRLHNAKIGRFKPIADFDWQWPKRIDRELIDELFSLDFIEEQGNVVLMGPNGVGKTTIAQNLAYQAVLKGYTVRFITASELLNELAAHDSPTALARRLRCFSRPVLLVIDEVGYLSYDTRHADLLFDIVSRRNGQHSTIVTTNRPFSEWHEVFPNASSVVALIDRLVHKAEIVQIEGESYRLKEAKERAERRRDKRTRRPGKAAS
jgi:DNA replication protein DnaC